MNAVEVDPRSPMHYRSIADINIYDSPALERLATQMAKGRYLRMVGDRVQLLEDGYKGFMRSEDTSKLQFAGLLCYYPPVLTRSQIEERLSAAITYTQAAMQRKNEYLWGGTVPPNYDCSGLMQAAFAAVGVWIPRDAYQQEAFCSAIALEDLQPGDLVFFGNETRATHVGMCLGGDRYIHSSGKEYGRDGIGIDSLSGEDSVARWYARQLRGAGRVMSSYQPQLD